jgi:hypothetical protein
MTETRNYFKLSQVERDEYMVPCNLCAHAVEESHHPCEFCTAHPDRRSRDETNNV